MPTAAQIMAQYGLVNTDAIVQAAQMEGIDLAAAATMMAKESSGRMVWGGDPVSTGGVYTKGGPVTRENYLAYRALADAGRIGRQGVGMSQLTSRGFQDSGDALGGCWDPVANARAGFRGLQALIATYGLREGSRRYNGSGPMAERYAADFMSRYATWKSRLAGATVPPPPDPDGDAELNAQQATQLDEIHDRICRLETAWAGGVTDDKNTPYDLRLLANRNNVEVRQMWLAVQALSAKVDALVAKLA